MSNGGSILVSVEVYRLAISAMYLVLRSSFSGCDIVFQEGKSVSHGLLFSF